MPSRSPNEIRASVEATRQELEFSINDLQSKVHQLSDWRGQLRQHRKQVIIGAAVAGFVIGGGIAAVTGLFRR
jgi:chromosome condensin MukBEF ATPase and DNA-binding subunit MukB